MDITAIYPGTFDPITYGHIDIAKRAARLFRRVIVSVAAHTTKTPLFTLEERVVLAQVTLGDLPNVAVQGFSGLLADFALRSQAQVIVRGLRAVSDFEYEFQLAGMNRSLIPQIETIFFTTATQHTYTSSSLVREIASLGGSIEGFVPAHVAEALYRKYRTSKTA